MLFAPVALEGERAAEVPERRFGLCNNLALTL